MTHRPSKILVTGGTGFVGRQLVPRLIAAGYGVRVAVLLESEEVPGGVEKICIGKIGPETAWVEALRDISAVVHLAGRAHFVPSTPAEENEFFEVNQFGVQRLACEASAAGVRSLIHVSSIAAGTKWDQIELSPAHPLVPETVYGQSKLLGEQAIAVGLLNSSTSFTILRPVVMYGPRDPGNVGKLMRLAKRGVPLPFGALRENRGFLFVLNFVDLILQCLDNESARNKVFLVSDPEISSTADILQRISDNCGTRWALFSVPDWALRGLGGLGDLAQKLLHRKLPVNSAAVEKLTCGVVINSDRTFDVLGWRPPFTLQEGLRLTLEHWSDQTIPLQESEGFQCSGSR